MAFLMNHGEKIVAAVFAMLGCLALTTANWATTDKSPVALQKTADDNKSKIELNDWPEDDKKWFQDIPDVLRITSEEGGQIVNVADFRIEPFTVDLAGAKEKRKAVEVLAPFKPRAVAVVFPLAKPAEEEAAGIEAEPTEGGNPAKDTEEAPMTDEEKAAQLLAEKFGIRPAGVDLAGGPGGELGPGGDEYGAEYGAPGMDDRMMAMGGAGNPYDAPNAYGDGMIEMYGEGMMNVTKKNIQVSAGICATMVIDLQKQREQVRQALHLKGNYLVAQNQIMYVDLAVERRPAGDRTGEWEPISADDLAEILSESLGFDRDVVSPAITRSAITMPLPRRAAGVWQASEVSHPRVEEFVLSPEEKELIDKFNQILTEKIAEAEEAAPVAVQPRGFSGFAQSASEMSMYGGGMGMEEDYSDEFAMYETSMASGQPGGSAFKLTDAQKQLLDATKATAEHRLLLVRFMDFTVERGKAYQYRARVVMKNPNYDFPLDELEDPALAAEPELVSSWSDPTPPVMVPFGSRIYLADVTARYGDQEKAKVVVYTDTTETGLSVMGAVTVPVGMPIAGTESLEVVDLTSDSLETREITLRSDELLAAAEELHKLSSTDHPELKAMLDKLDRARKPIPDQICVVDNKGGLELRATDDNQQQQTADRNEYTGILKIYEPWKTKANADPGSEFFGTSDEGAMMDEGAGYGLGMEAASSASYKTKSGRRMSSREENRKRRTGELPPRGAMDMESGLSP